MGKKWLQTRPDWCPYPDSCRFKRRVTDTMCGGELEEPVMHNGVKDDVRLCLSQHGSDRVDSYAMAEHDLDWLRWVMDALDGRETSRL